MNEEYFSTGDSNEEPTRGDDSEEGNDEALGDRLSGMLKFLASVFVVGVIAIGIAAAANWFSYYQLDQMRQLQQAPDIFSSEFVEGAATVTGTVVSGRNTLTGSVSGEDAIYYDYRKQRRREDRDGEMESWSTRLESERAVNFVVERDGEAVEVRAANQTDAIDFVHGHSDRDRDRSRERRRRVEERERERRIEPGDEVFVFGYGHEVDGAPVIEFRRSGDYRPVIAAGTESGYKTRQMLWSIVGILVGIIGVFFATLLLHPVLSRLARPLQPLVDRFRLDEAISIGFMTRGYLLVTAIVVIIAFGFQIVLLVG